MFLFRTYVTKIQLLLSGKRHLDVSESQWEATGTENSKHHIYRDSTVQQDYQVKDQKESPKCFVIRM